jgi:hypothetical protein
MYYDQSKQRLPQMSIHVFLVGGSFRKQTIYLFGKFMLIFGRHLLPESVSRTFNRRTSGHCLGTSRTVNVYASFLTTKCLVLLYTNTHTHTHTHTHSVGSNIRGSLFLQYFIISVKCEVSFILVKQKKSVITGPKFFAVLE